MKRFYGIFALLVVGLGYGSWILADSVLPPKRTAPIRAQLVPRFEAELSVALSEPVASIDSMIGVFVKKGTPLLRLNCSELKLEVEKLGLIAQFDAQNYQRQKQLYAKKLSATQDFEEAVKTYKESALDLKMAQNRLNLCVLRAPFDGVVVEKMIEPYEYTAPGKILLKFMDVRSAYIEWLMPSEWLNHVQPGQVFRIKIDQDSKTYPAQVVYISPKIDPTAQRFKMSGQFIQPFPETLKVGMTGEILFET
jgi:RND family efflux transporter MFP subunit